MYFWAFLFAIFTNVLTRPVVVNGGEITINGVVTDTQIDFTINYTSNIKWLAVILSEDEVNTDLHLIVRDTTDAARPVKVSDCYLDENSYIMKDDVDNIMPSITSFWGDTSYGLKIAYNRALNTNDLQDRRLYKNEIIQVCFMSSLEDFVGGGYEFGHEKVCSFLTLHSVTNQLQDRLLGNFAGTTLLGGGNLTVYATQSTDGSSLQPWLFFGLVHRQQGLSPFVGRWIGVTYKNSTTNADLSVIHYGMQDNLRYEVQVNDMFMVNSSFADKDENFPSSQGSSDDVITLGVGTVGQKMIALYKRKLNTGDNNRDSDITWGQNVFCFLLGNTWLYSTFNFTQRVCLNITLETSYSSTFRVSEQEQQTVIEYVEPPNKVIVVKWQKLAAISFIFLSLIL